MGLGLSFYMIYKGVIMKLIKKNAFLIVICLFSSITIATILNLTNNFLLTFTIMLPVIFVYSLLAKLISFIYKKIKNKKRISEDRNQCKNNINGDDRPQ